MSEPDQPENLDLFAPVPPASLAGEGERSGGEPETPTRPDGGGQADSPGAPLEGPPPLWVEEESSRARPQGESRPKPASQPGPRQAPAVKVKSSNPESAGVPADESEPPIWSVSQVNRGVRTMLESTFAQIWVSGEVGRWTRHNSGHCYFALKDDRAQLRCVMFQSDASKLPIDPDEGMTVRVFGSVTLYESRGEFQLVVRRLETDTGEGLWRLAFQRLQAKLAAEGLLADERKRPLPRFPASVGVVTSPTGAALHDILTVVARRAPWTRVILAGARVQGAGAAEEIASAIGALSRSGLVDVIIAGRGGGSIEDLWAFNEEVVARAIVSSQVPVISAVGHEVDVTIADLVADHRAPTPSAAAEAAVPDGEALHRTMGDARIRLERGLRGAVATRTRRLSERVAQLRKAAHRLLEPRRQAVEASRSRMERALRRMFGPRRRTLEDGRTRLTRAVRSGLAVRRSSLSSVAGRMNALSPLSTLTRGYAVPLDGDGRVLRRVDAFAPGERFSLRVVDGRVECETLGTDRIEDGSMKEGSSGTSE